MQGFLNKFMITKDLLKKVEIEKLYCVENVEQINKKLHFLAW